MKQPPRQNQNTQPERGLHLRFSGDQLAVRGALRRLRRAVGSFGMGADQLGLVELVLGEVLNNVVEHAYGAGAPGVIEMDCEPRDGAVAFVVRDFGREMPEGRLPEGLPVDLNRVREDLPEGGFGWFLVRSLVRGLSYRREAGCNHLSFTIPVADHDRSSRRADPARGSR